MGTIRSVDHVAIVVPSIAQTVPLFCDVLGAEFLSGGDDPETGIRFVHLHLPGFKLELMQPLRADSFLQRHLDEHGPGFHHLTLLVDDVTGPVKHNVPLVETARNQEEREPGLSLDDVLEGRVVRRNPDPCLHAHGMGEVIHLTGNRRSDTDAFPPPEALLRSRRQGEILAAILAEPESEFPISGLARRLGIPYSSVHREVTRAERLGVVITRRFENLRLVKANIDNPYLASLAQLLAP